MHACLMHVYSIAYYVYAYSISGVLNYMHTLHLNMHGYGTVQVTSESVHDLGVALRGRHLAMSLYKHTYLVGLKA